MSHHRPAPSAASISDALAALGVYASVPSSDDLQRQATDAGGEPVLRAALANALYGASISTGMHAEARLLQDCDGTTKQLGLARHQALRASGATGPGIVGVMHWQATHIAQPLQIWAGANDLGPLGSAAAAAASALMLILDTLIGPDPSDHSTTYLLEALDQAREHLAAATASLRVLSGESLDLAAELTALLAAASSEVGPTTNGQSGP